MAYNLNRLEEKIDRYKASLPEDRVGLKRPDDVVYDDGLDRPLRRPGKASIQKVEIPAFEYKHLKPASPSIRLIQLLPGGRWDRIKCNLEVDFVGSMRCRNYDAVSYYWGTGKQTCPIDLNGAEFMVFPNVANILSRLRNEKEPRWLWMDMICINQEDEDEKSNQVKRMKDIFSQAQTVIASLGPHEGCGISILRDSKQSEMQKALKLINSPQWRNWRAAFNKPLSESEERSLLTLLGHSWFERIWVVQEVAAARNLRVICGDEQVKGEAFAGLYSRMLERARGDELKARLSELRPFLEYLSGEAKEDRHRPELLELLQRFRPWKATDPHDKVYALLGISGDGQDKELLKPNYKLPVEVVYQKVAQYMIARYSSLAVLSYAGCQPQPKSNYEVVQQTASLLFSWLLSPVLRAPTDYGFESLKLPSWCPDWRVPYNLTQGFDVAQTETSMPLWDATRRSALSRSTLDGRIRFDPELTNGVLRVSGCSFATAGHLMDVGMSTYVQQRLSSPALANTCSLVSGFLWERYKLLDKVNGGRSIETGDRLCFLDGCAGVAILRPQIGKYSLILLEHSDFDVLRIEDGFLTCKDASQSIFKDIMLELSRSRSCPAGYDRIRIPTETFEIV